MELPIVKKYSFFADNGKGVNFSFTKKIFVKEALSLAKFFFKVDSKEEKCKSDPDPLMVIDRATFSGDGNLVEFSVYEDLVLEIDGEECRSFLSLSRGNARAIGNAIFTSFSLLKSDL